MGLIVLVILSAKKDQCGSCELHDTQSVASGGDRLKRRTFVEY